MDDPLDLSSDRLQEVQGRERIPRNKLKRKRARIQTPSPEPHSWPLTKHRARQIASDVLATIFYDIHDVCELQRGVSSQPTGSDVYRYIRICNDAIAIFGMAVIQKANLSNLSFEKSKEDEKIIRQLKSLEVFIQQCDWKSLAICAYADAFRFASHDLHPGVWNELVDLISLNRLCIDVFARTRSLPWRDLLLRHGEYITKIKQESFPVQDIGMQHMHQIVRLRGGKIGRPSYEGHLQIHVDNCIFDPSKWNGKEDPTLRTAADGRCDLCRSKEICDCKLNIGSRYLVEIFEYPQREHAVLVENPPRNYGIRSLGKFKRGWILDQFVGELLPPESQSDPTYSLAHESKDKTCPVAIISPKCFGNWTRYINHSCSPNTAFVRRTIGSRTMMTVEAIRNIGPFEQITVDYGPDFWRNKACECGMVECRSRKFY